VKSFAPASVAQGDADQVIPRELLDRTWTYLAGQAGSTTTAVRDPGGHGLSAAVVRELHRWLTGLTTDPNPGADERPR
jgi:phospholipase/carboxylesterase